MVNWKRSIGTGIVASLAFVVATASAGQAALIDITLPNLGDVLPPLPSIAIGGAAVACGAASDLPAAGATAGEACADTLLPIAVGNAPRDAIPDAIPLARGAGATSGIGGSANGAGAAPAGGSATTDAGDDPVMLSGPDAARAWTGWMIVALVAIAALALAFAVGRKSAKREARNAAAAEPSP